MSNVKPPRWIDRLLEWYCSDQYLEEVQGDLHEWFKRRERKSGLFKARLFYFFDVIAYLRLFRIKKLNNMKNNNLLLLNYVKMAFRQFRRNSVYASLNTFSLTIGLLSTILISIYMLDELSFDRFHEEHQSIYRLINHSPKSGRMGDSTPSPWKANMAEAFPEILDHTRLGHDIVLVDDGEQNYLENGLYWADGNFMSFFSFEVISGNRSTMLSAPNTIVMTRSKAMRYFGRLDIIGETLPIKVYDGNKDFLMQVTGVIEDVPANSHLRFDLLGSMSTTAEMYGEFEQYWGLNWLQAYVKLPDETHLPALSARVPDFFVRYAGEQFAADADIIFQPLTEVRLFSEKVEGRMAKGDITNIYIFGFVAILVLLAASINYVNLITARSTKRGKEVGMRKVFGAGRGQVVRQFYIECGIQLTLAFALTLGLAMLVLPVFNSLVDKDLKVGAIFQLPVLAIIGGVFVLILLLAGFYPAIVMNRFRPVQVLKGNLLGALGDNAWFRQTQVLVQFAIATFLISSTLIVVHQMKYMQAYDMGFKSEQLINIPVDDREMQSKLNLIREKMKQVPGVAGITASGEGLPSAMNNTWGFSWQGMPEEQEHGINVVAIDYDYFKTIGTYLVDGRNISIDMPSDSGQVCILNEAAFALTGWTDLAERQVEIGGNTRNVVGVVKNFQYNSLHSSVAPCAYVLVRPGLRVSPDNLIIRMEAAGLSESLERIEGIWQEFSNQPFAFSFVDKAFAQLYGDEQQFMRLVVSFAVIGVFLAVLGLISLVSFVGERRSREISIRKVLGASRKGILVKITGQFFYIFLISVLVALPLSRLAMEAWLQGFAYRTEVGWSVFVLSALVSIVIVLLSVGLQALRAASTNPVRHLSDH